MWCCFDRRGISTEQVNFLLGLVFISCNENLFLTRHKANSCPAAPNISELESQRRKRRRSKSRESLQPGDDQTPGRQADSCAQILDQSPLLHGEAGLLPGRQTSGSVPPLKGQPHMSKGRLPPRTTCLPPGGNPGPAPPPPIGGLPSRRAPQGRAPTGGHPPGGPPPGGSPGPAPPQPTGGPQQPPPAPPLGPGPGGPPPGGPPPGGPPPGGAPPVGPPGPGPPQPPGGPQPPPPPPPGGPPPGGPPPGGAPPVGPPGPGPPQPPGGPHPPPPPPPGGPPPGGHPPGGAPPVGPPGPGPPQPPGGPQQPPQPPPPPPGGPAAVLHPDPDTLPARHQAAIFGIIMNLSARFTNKENRWISRGGNPAGPHYPQNRSWGRVANKFQLPEYFSDTEHRDCFFVTKQGLYQFRDDYITPMLQQRVRNAQGGARSLPRGLTSDSLTAMFLLKVHHDPSYRLLGTLFGIDSSQAQRWVTQVLKYMFLNDVTLIRNRNLANPANLEDLYEEAHQATLHDSRAMGIYSHLQVPGTRLIVAAVDSRAVKAMKSTDMSLQSRSFSSKIKDNAVQKMTIASMAGKALISFPLMVAISPAGTDESNCEHLIVLEEGGIPGGLRTILETRTPNNRPQYTFVLLAGMLSWDCIPSPRENIRLFQKLLFLKILGLIYFFVFIYPCH